MNIAGAAAGLAAFLVTLTLAEWVCKLCHRWGILDFPGPLKTHTIPAPRLGGIAIVAGLCAAVLISAAHVATREWPFFVALGLIWITGLADDLRGLSPFIRLGTHFAAGLVLWLGGWRLPLLDSGVVGLAAICFYIALFVNTFNLLDGSDGLAAGTSGIAAIAFAALLAGTANAFAPVLAWSLAGACAGFLISNYPPARLYMGDEGSTSLGLVVAFLGLEFYRSGPPTASRILAPILISALPLLDVFLAVFRRMWNGRSPFYGDRHHLYDGMAVLGASPRCVALSYYAATIVFTCAAWLIQRKATAVVVSIVGLSMGGLLAAAIRLDALKLEKGNAALEKARSPSG